MVARIGIYPHPHLSSNQHRTTPDFTFAITICLALSSQYLNSTSGAYSLTLKALANIFILHCPTLTINTPLFLRDDQIHMPKFPLRRRKHIQGYLRIHDRHIAIMPHQPLRTLVCGFRELGTQDGEEETVFGPETPDHMLAQDAVRVAMQLIVWEVRGDCGLVDGVQGAEAGC